MQNTQVLTIIRQPELRLRVSSTLRTLKIGFQSQRLDYEGFKNLHCFSTIIVDKEAFEAARSQNLLDLNQDFILISEAPPKGLELDQLYRILEQGALIPIFIPISGQTLLEMLNLSIHSPHLLMKWRVFVLKSSPEIDLSPIEISQINQLQSLGDLTRLAALEQIAWTGSKSSDLAYNILNSLLHKYSSSPLLGDYAIEVLDKLGQRDRAFFHGLRLFRLFQTPHFFRSVFELCQKDFTMDQSKKKLEVFMESFPVPERNVENPYYRELVQWYCEHLRVWQDIQFLTKQMLDESRLSKEINPHLVPFLNRLIVFIEKRKHITWINQQIRPVLRSGLDLGLLLDPLNMDILQLVLELDQLEGNHLGLKHFSYLRNLNLPVDEFYEIYAHYCLYLNDQNEASYAILRSTKLELDPQGLSQLRQQWNQKYLLTNQRRSVS
jgi:hypothetical protein